jgi:lipopolysaccharide transport system ATP-binding protein
LKRYSSGMSARLGFSVAAHLDPEVLLIDEVLTVGDAAFQRKAFERLEQILSRDVAVILVSHQLDRVAHLCNQAILLTEGRIVTRGTADECVAAYVGDTGDGAVAAGCPVTIEGISEAAPARVTSGERVRVTIRGLVSDPAAAQEATVGVRVRAVGPENLVFATHSKAAGLVLPPGGAFLLEVDLAMNLPPGPYRVQPVVWHAARVVEWARGPSCMVSVTGRPDAFGPAFLSPRLRLLADD